MVDPELRVHCDRRLEHQLPGGGPVLFGNQLRRVEHLLRLLPGQPSRYPSGSRSGWQMPMVASLHLDHAVVNIHRGASTSVLLEIEEPDGAPT